MPNEILQRTKRANGLSEDPVTPYEDTLNWQNSSFEDVANLFYYLPQGEEVSKRIYSYAIDKQKLLSLVSGSGTVFWIYLARKAAASFSEPPFALIIQKYAADVSPISFDNSFYMTPLTNGGPYGSQIPAGEAEAMIQRWQTCKKEDIPYSTQSMYGRLRSYCYHQEDVDAIRQFVEQHQDEELVLFAHLGLWNLGPKHPFEFRVILQIQAQMTASPTSIYFEFSYPCPPNC